MGRVGRWITEPGKFCPPNYEYLNIYIYILEDSLIN